MKKLLLYSICMAAAMSAYAQDNYSFSSRTENYTEMTSGTVVSASDWDDFEYQMLMPFSFKYFGISVDSITIADDGLYFTTTNDDYLSPHGLNGIARGADMSPVSYRVDGSGNERILKIQWPNITFAATKDSFDGDFVNYQVWLYEGSNVIEFHYGSSYVSEAALSTIDLLPNMEAIQADKGIALTGDPANPTVTYDLLNATRLNANPSVNSIYVFTPGWATSFQPVTAMGIKTYPVPFGNTLHISAEAELISVRVYNAEGKCVETHLASTDMLRLPTKNWQNGVYFLQIETVEGTVTRKVVK